MSYLFFATVYDSPHLLKQLTQELNDVGCKGRVQDRRLSCSQVLQGCQCAQHQRQRVITPSSRGLGAIWPLSQLRLEALCCQGKQSMATHDSHDGQWLCRFLQAMKASLH